jgi:hypothetical protein
MRCHTADLHTGFPNRREDPYGRQRTERVALSLEILLDGAGSLRPISRKRDRAGSLLRPLGFFEGDSSFAASRVDNKPTVHQVRLCICLLLHHTIRPLGYALLRTRDRSNS